MWMDRWKKKCTREEKSWNEGRSKAPIIETHREETEKAHKGINEDLGEEE